MKDAKRCSAVKKVHTRQVEGHANNKAKAHKVHKKPAQAQGEDSRSEMDDAIEEDQEVEQQEEQQEEQEGDCQRDEDERPLRRLRPKSVKRNTTAFGNHCPRRPGLCKTQCKR